MLKKQNFIEKKHSYLNKKQWLMYNIVFIGNLEMIVKQKDELTGQVQTKIPSESERKSFCYLIILILLMKRTFIFD